MARPEVRQCLNEESPSFGAVAVKGQRWGIMHPQNGGHWGSDDEVEEWTVLTDE